MNLNYDYYEGSDLTYPNRPVKPFINRQYASASDLKKCAAELEAYEQSLPAYEEKLSAYRVEMSKRQEEWQNDLFNTYGVVGNPKAIQCFNIAWEEGHGAGLHEVEVYFSRFVELIK